MLGKLVIVFLSALTYCIALNTEGLLEGDCITPPTAEDLDFLWLMGGAETWYHPLWSKSELYRVAEDVTGNKIETLTEEDISRSCLETELGGMDGAKVIGFGGKEALYEMSLRDEGNINRKLKPKGGESVTEGVSTLTLTDNQTYIVVVNCWSDNQQKTFSVMATKRKLGKKAKAAILEHIESLGFNPANVYEMKYDDCLPKKVVDEL